MPQDLTTIPEVRSAIKKAKAVYCQIRFGVSEAWVPLTKKAAMEFIDTIPDDADPENFSMFGGTTFAVWEDDGTLSLG